MRIRIVPNTGIQYVNLDDIDLNEATAFTRRVEIGDKPSTARPSAATLDDDDAEHDLKDARDRVGIVREPKKSTRDNDWQEQEERLSTRSATADALLQAVAECGGLWIPVPFDRGRHWASVFLKMSTSGKLSAVLAIDTTLAGQGNPEGLEVDDIGEREISPTSRSFWNSQSVDSYLKWLGRKMKPALQSERVKVAGVREYQLSIIALAGYLQSRQGGLHVLFEACPERGQTVKVNVVLDLGNSRTCVLLKENAVDSRAERLSLIYPSDPTTPHTCPFETQSAMVKHELVESDSNPSEGFRFLSMIQMGPPARSLLRAKNLDPRPLGVSSPKRYLWDERDPLPWEWCLADRLNEQKLPPRIAGDILRRMSTLRPLASPNIPEVPATPNYPRLACSVWTIVEILEQSFRQMNSVAWRKSDSNAPLCERRREISSLVIIYPAGMHRLEIKNYRRACETASRLWAEFRTNPDLFCSGSEVPLDAQFGIPRPAVQTLCDEALAIQVCWLFGEVMHRHGGRVKQVIEHLGRDRGDGEVKERILRVASLDIGGGTTDLAIADYAHDTTKDTGAALTCRRKFHDGISRAGDDIMRALLEQGVFPAIVKQTEIPEAEWNDLFAPTTLSDEASKLRRKLVRDAWMPVALKCLEAVESGQDVPFTIGSVVVGDLGETLEKLQAELQKKGQRLAKSIHDVTISIDRSKMRAIVRNAIGKTISQCADIVDQYQCDLLIVGGRPSSNPAVRDQIYAAMAVPPGQVVFLSELSVGDWYPFARTGGKIGDAKTCGVVGSAIAFEAMYGQSSFSLRVLPSDVPKAIVGFLGQVKSGQPANFPESAVFDLDGGTERTMMPLNGLRLASRRVAGDAAEAKPIYEYRLKRRYMDALKANPVFSTPIRVKFGREDEEIAPPTRLGERIEMMNSSVSDQVRVSLAIGEIPNGNGGSVDATDAMELVLKTLLDSDGYWIDTGQFQVIETLEGGH